MRELLYVAIIHSESDLGSLGPALDRRSASLYGQKRWAEHKETVTGFWRSLEDYLLSLDAARLKIYQDGLAAEGELGRRVVEEAAGRGSRNHQIILSLISKGAELRKTEDASLLMQELRLAHEESSTDRSGLTEERDRFIAGTIAETLREGELGLLFIGAYHYVNLYLPKDIAVQPLKEPDKVRAYFDELVGGRGGGGRLEKLARYLTAPVGAKRRA